MKKSDAKIRLVSDKIETLSYSIYDNEYWGYHDVRDIEACFLLSHTPSEYYPDYVKACAEMLEALNDMRSDKQDAEDIAELERVLPVVREYCQKRDIEIN